MRPRRWRAWSILAGAGLAVGAFATAGAPLRASASSGATITGSSTQLTTNPADEFDPAISGNIVAYTDERSGNANLWYYDLVTGTEHQVTTSTSDQELADVSGSTIVYVDQSPLTGGGDVKGFTIGGSIFPIGVGPSAQTEPSISGSLVAWQDNLNGNFEIYAKDLTTGILKRLTTNPTSNDATPNVSGRLVAYSSQDSVTGVTQVFVTNFDTELTTQLTTVGDNRFPDVSGTRVVYQGDRGGTTGQDIFVYDLTTMTETQVSLPGMQRNPHISGDWVSFEDVTSTGVSSIDLYYVPTGQVFTAVAGSSLSNSAYLNDIDGQTVAYTSNAAGNQDIYVYRFTVSPAIPTVSDLSTLVGQLVSAGCIDNAGIGNALIAKLSAAQSAINGGDLKTAINILTAFINQVQAQNGKHVLTSCTFTGTTVNPAAMLIADAQSIIDSLKVSADPNPITGSALTATGSAVAGATLSLVDATGTTLSTATSDVTGFYFFATTGLLAPGGSYSISVTGLPSGFASSSPASQPFTWVGNALRLSNFTLS